LPRLFSAFEIPPDIAAQLAFFRGGLHGARWIEPADYHLTLRFFGDIDARAAQALAADLAESETLSGGAPLRLELDEIGVFGGRSPRALFARVKSDPLLTRLQGAHESIARRNGLAPETRKFAPHVTLARLRGVSSGAVGAWLAERAFPLALAFAAKRFVLYSSRDSIGGGPYKVEAAYPFCGDGQD
jgi:RNA 2',3'-cyclic 3'-phosphodiesterase